jgi:hypothetical protein
MDLVDVNTALCRALGFGDVENINGLVLQLSPDKPPVVTVQRLVLSEGAAVADAVQTVVDVYSLEPKEQTK